MNENPITSLAGQDLRILARIRNIYLNDTLLETFPEIELPKLESLYLAGTKITTPPQLDLLPKLWRLGLGHLPLRTLKPILRHSDFQRRYHFLRPQLPDLDKFIIEASAAEQWQLSKTLMAVQAFCQGHHQRLRNFATRIDGSDYLTLPVVMRMEEAHKLCEYLGCSLATIRSAESSLVLGKMVANCGHQLLIGYTIDEFGNQFWHSGEATTYRQPFIGHVPGHYYLDPWGRWRNEQIAANSMPTDFPLEAGWIPGVILEWRDE